MTPSANRSGSQGSTACRWSSHSREADDDTLRLLNEEGASEVGGAWHYFQGDLRLAEQVLSLGFYISLAKPLLRIPELQAAVEQLPLSRIVIETDSYPQPFKKNPIRRTEPWHLPQVAERLAELQRTDVETVAATTTANYLRMLGGRISPDALPLDLGGGLAVSKPACALAHCAVRLERRCFL